VAVTGRDEFTRKIVAGEPFTIVKFGDGEFICMSGRWGTWTHNSSGDTYNAELGRMQRDAFAFFCENERSYIAELQSPTRGVLTTRAFVAELHAKYGRPEERQRSADVHVFYLGNFSFSAGVKSLENVESLRQFYSAVRRSKRRKVFVGAERLAPAAAFLRADERIVVPTPPVSAFSRYNDLRERLCGLPEGTIVAFSCGLTAKALIRDTMESEKGPVTCLDFGSSFDQLCGVKKWSPRGKQDARPSRTWAVTEEETRKFFASAL
jgi:hypothetical protein